MKNVWVYHINPKSPENYKYGWDVNEPKTILETEDLMWHASNMRRQLGIGDMLCVYSKKMLDKSDGVYVAGTITEVDPDEGMFTWQPEQRWSARLIVAPILTETLRVFFGRGYGSPMQRLPPHKKAKWLALLDANTEVVDGVPVVTVPNAEPSGPSTAYNPVARKENGHLGEKFILKLLKKRYPRAAGYQVIHVAESKPSSDHDIAVYKAGTAVRLVEVKTRVGWPNEPVLISEYELGCRRLHKHRHSIFIVYLGRDKTIASVLELADEDTYTLSTRQYWLHPAVQ